MLIFRDSFDFYGSQSEMGLGMWDTAYAANAALDGTNTRFGVGQSLKLGGGSYNGPKKVWGTNESVVFLSFAFLTSALNSMQSDGFGFVFFDGTTVQLSMAFRSNGTLTIMQGNYGTVLATIPAAFSGNVWTHFQIQIVFNATTGSVRIRKNGNPSDDYAFTGLKTIQSANPWANGFAISGFSRYDTITYWIDDFVIHSGSGSGPWNDWVGDIRSVQVMAGGGTSQKALTPSASTVTFGSQLTTFSTGWGSGLQVRQFVVPNSGVITSMTTLLSSNINGGIQLVVYDSDGLNGAPKTLLAYSAGLTNPVAGTQVFPLTSSLIVQAGHALYVGFLSANNTNLYFDNTVTTPSYTQTVSYASGPPASFSGTSSGNQAVPAIWADIAVSNWGLVSERTRLSNGSYVIGYNAGDYDLYFTEQLSVTPAAILGVSMRGSWSKTESDLREACVSLKSGAAVMDTAATVLASNPVNLNFVVDVDPATGQPWTAAALNNLQFGPKVVV